MANTVYPSYKSAVQKGEIDLLSDDIVVYAVDTDDYTYNAAHAALADIPAGARVAVSGNLDGKTVSAAGRFDSDNPTLPSVSGDEFEALVLYDVTADQLIVYYDGYTQTPSGNNIDISVHANGWFDL